MKVGLGLSVISIDFGRSFMKYFKKALVSALVSASVCSAITKAMPAAGWVGIGFTSLATVGIPIAIACARSGKKGEKELCAADPNQPPVTDEKKRQVLFSFLSKYLKKSSNDPWDVKVNKKVKNKVVEVEILDGKEYKTIKGSEAKDKANLQVLGDFYAHFLNSGGPGEKVSCDGFKYGLSFSSPLRGFYEVFVSDDCKFIKAVGIDEYSLCPRASVTLKVD